MMDLDTTVTLDDKQLSTKELLYVDQTNLPDEFAAQAARYAYFGVLSANADYAFNVAKDTSKRIYADVFNQIKQNPDNIPVGGKTVSDALAENLTLTSETYVTATGKELELQRQSKVLRALADAFEQRAHMLRELGQSARSEMAQTNMQVRQEPTREQRLAALQAKKEGKKDTGYNAAEFINDVPEEQAEIERRVREVEEQEQLTMTPSVDVHEAVSAGRRRTVQQAVRNIQADASGRTPVRIIKV